MFTYVGEEREGGRREEEEEKGVEGLLMGRTDRKGTWL